MVIDNRKRMILFRKNGFTLIELMVAMTIGSISIGAATGLFKMVIAQNYTVSRTAQIQEESFFISHVIKQQLAQIGFRPIDLSKFEGRSSPIAAHEVAFPEVLGTWDAGQTLNVTANALSYRYYGASSEALEADGSIYDCLGNAVAEGIVQVNTISVENKQLVCTTDTDSVVIAGEELGVLVDDIVYEVGVDDNDDDIIDRIISGVGAMNTNYINAKHIKVRLLLATPDGVTQDYQNYYFNNAEHIATDRRFRSETEISMTLRN